MNLHELLKLKVAKWRNSNYKSEYPVIYEILITDRDEIGFENINKVREVIYGYRGK